MTNRKGNKTKKSSLIADQKYNQWKSLVPMLYDCHMNHHLDWLSLSCRRGSLLEEGRSKNDQRLYLLEQTDCSVSKTLIVANVEVVKRKTASIEHVSEFDEKEPNVRIFKTIIYPGEALIWDVPDHESVRGAEDFLPNLILTGHQQNAEFALSTCPTEPLVLSGGKDELVLLWSILDHLSTLGEASLSSVGPRGVFQGHRNMVGDVQFCPNRGKVVDFHWNPCDPHGLLSVYLMIVATKAEVELYSMANDGPKEEVLAELEQVKSHMIKCKDKSVKCVTKPVWQRGTQGIGKLEELL